MQDIEIKESPLDFRAKEAFKTLRTNIEFSGEAVKVIALTSATPNEGKSTVSYELAQTFAQAGKKTLLIDADLRKSVMRAKQKKGSVKNGLTNYLVGKCPLDDVLCKTNENNFYMIFAGPVPPNPSELLGGVKFKKMLTGLRSVFDMIIIDTPPIGSAIDAAIISKSCDGIAVVMGAGEISYQFAQRIREQLEAADAKVLGVILNKVDMSDKSGYGKYYGRYYGKYYGNYE